MLNNQASSIQPDLLQNLEKNIEKIKNDIVTLEQDMQEEANRRDQI